MKMCRECNFEKPFSEFYNNKKTKDGMVGKCKDCFKKYYLYKRDVIKEKTRDYKRLNSETIKLKKKDYNKRNAKKISEYNREYGQKNRDAINRRSREYAAKNRDQLKYKRRKYRQENIETVNSRQREYRRIRREKDPTFALVDRLRFSMNGALVRGEFSKSKKTLDVLGCTSSEFSAHIERQFIKGMSWENRSKWHLDHIIPISSAVSESDIYALSHFTNIRPMWAEDNMSKGSKMEYLI